MTGLEPATRSSISMLCICSLKERWLRLHHLLITNRKIRLISQCIFWLLTRISGFWTFSLTQVKQFLSGVGQWLHAPSSSAAFWVPWDLPKHHQTLLLTPSCLQQAADPPEPYKTAIKDFFSHDLGLFCQDCSFIGILRTFCVYVYMLMTSQDFWTASLWRPPNEVVAASLWICLFLNRHHSGLWS